LKWQYNDIVKNELDYTITDDLKTAGGCISTVSFVFQVCEQISKNKMDSYQR
jgi:hypothetical protein